MRFENDFADAIVKEDVLHSEIVSQVSEHRFVANTSQEVQHLEEFLPSVV